MRTEASKMFSMHSILFQDEMFQFGGFTSHEQDYYTIDFNTNRPYMDKDTVHLQIRFEMNPHKKEVERVVYGILDLLGDTGGFLEAEVWFVYMALFLFSFEPLNVFLIKRLFQFQANSD